MSNAGRLGRNPFGEKAKPASPSQKASAPSEEVDEEIAPQGLLTQVLVKAAVELPADLFVFGIKTRACLASWLD
jgi:hypothetical protein